MEKYTIHLGSAMPHTVGVASSYLFLQLSPVIATSSRPLLPSVPAQLTIPQPPTSATALPHYPSTSTPPRDTPSLLPPATVTTLPDLSQPVTAHTLGMKVWRYLCAVLLFTSTL